MAELPACHRLWVDPITAPYSARKAMLERSMARIFSGRFVAWRLSPKKAVRSRRIDSMTVRLDMDGDLPVVCDPRAVCPPTSGPVAGSGQAPRALPAKSWPDRRSDREPPEEGPQGDGMAS